MKTALMLVLGASFGWFARGALDTYPTDDWKTPALWAGLAVVDMGICIVLFQ